MQNEEEDEMSIIISDRFHFTKIGFEFKKEKLFFLVLASSTMLILFEGFS
jgi:hypothetical protein